MSQYTEMHWTAVKRLVEANGGEWSNVKAGIEFLEDKETEAEPEPAVVDNTPLGWDNQAGEPEEPEAPVAEAPEVDISADGFKPKEPYGAVCGIDVGNAKYHQNGKFYDVNGKQVNYKG